MNDPIVDEVHETRERLLAECGGDLRKYMERLRSEAAVDRDRVVSRADLDRREKAPRGRAG